MPEWALLGFGALSVLALACSVFTWRRGAPSELFLQMETLNSNQQQLADEFESQARAWAAFKIDIDGQLEAMERVAGQVERTRRQQAARESKKKKEPEGPDTDTFGLIIGNPDARRAQLEALGR